MGKNLTTTVAWRHSSVAYLWSTVLQYNNIHSFIFHCSTLLFSIHQTLVLRPQSSPWRAHWSIQFLHSFLSVTNDNASSHDNFPISVSLLITCCQVTLVNIHYTAQYTPVAYTIHSYTNSVMTSYYANVVIRQFCPSVTPVYSVTTAEACRQTVFNYS